MPVYQAYNGKIKAWVKYKFIKGKKKGESRLRITDVKQRLPSVPFKGVPKRGNRK